MMALAGRLVRHGGWCRRDFRPAPLEADLNLAVADVEVGQIVPLHQADELVDFVDVERLVGFRRLLRHTMTPLRGDRVLFVSRLSVPSGFTTMPLARIIGPRPAAGTIDGTR